MADDNPQAPAGETTSYSDPLYDRLEGIIKKLGQYWMVLAAAVIAIIVALLMVQFADTGSQDAASALRYAQAARAGESPLAAYGVPPDFEVRLTALAEVAADDTVTSEFRSRAGMEAAALHLRARRPDDATPLIEDALKRAQSLSGAATDSKAKNIAGMLLASCLITKGSVLEMQDDLEGAIGMLDKVSADFARSQPIFATQATLSAALIRVELAARSDDPEAANGLRQLAFENLGYLRLEDKAALRDRAEIAYYDLLNKHPELDGGEPLPVVTPTVSTTAPVSMPVPADAPTVAPVVPAEAPADTEAANAEAPETGEELGEEPAE